MCDVARDGIASAANLARIAWIAKAFVKHVLAVAWELNGISERDIAACLRAERCWSCGKPALALRSTCRLAHASGFEGRPTPPLAEAHGARPVAGAALASVPAQAPCPSSDMLTQMETSVLLAQSSLLRVCAGFCVLLAYGRL